MVARALNLLATHRSYRVKKSSMQTVAVVEGGSRVDLALAKDGPAQENLPEAPWEGEAEGQGGGSCVLADLNDRPASPSAQGEGLPALPLGGEVAVAWLGGGGWPSQRGESRREVLTPQGLAANWQGLSAFPTIRVDTRITFWNSREKQDSLRFVFVSFFFLTSLAERNLGARLASRKSCRQIS